MSKFIKFELKNHIATISLERPEKKNALTLEMLQFLTKIGESLKSENNLRCVIILGKDGVFCSGIDTTNFAALANDKKLLESLMAPLEGLPGNQMQRPCLVWKEILVPVIAILDGPVFGAGLQLALGADIRISTPRAELSLLETQWGLIPDMGITQTLPKLMNYDQALLLTLTSRIIKGAEAKELGLTTICTDEPYKRGIELAKEFANKSPEALCAAKNLYKKAWEEISEDNLKLEALLQTQLIGTPNQMEAVFANIEKRTPNFKKYPKSNSKS